MIEYTVKRSNRKTVTIFIRAGGLVEVCCPNWMTSAQIRQIVADKTPEIERHLSPAPPADRKPDSKPGPKSGTKAGQKPTQDAAKFTKAQLDALVQSAKADIAARVAQFAPLVGVTYNRITIKRLRSRWGSCSSKGNLNFNCLLMLTPPHIRDYVVVHELCHRKQMNHSPLFWAEVARILPDHRSRREWLKKNGGALIRKLP